jgi:hypothetical protein
VALSGFIKSAIKWASGINWVNISIRFAMSVLENRVIPVKLPPGWLLGLQTHRALLRELTRPVVRRGTSFHAHQARRQRLEKCHHLASPKLLPDNHLLRRINTVNLEHVLGDIQTDRGNVHFPSCDSTATITLRQFIAGSERRPPHH